MQFEGKLDANLIKNNMVKENLDVDQKVKTGEENINTVEVAQKFLEDQRNLDKLDVAEKQQTPAKLDSIRKSMPKTENSQEAESHKAQRVEFVNKAYQMLIDNVQSQIDKKSIFDGIKAKGAFGFLNPKPEMILSVESLKNLQGKNSEKLTPGQLLDNQGRFANPAVKKEIKSMIEQFDPKDQEILNGTEQVQNQIENMTNVSS